MAVLVGSAMLTGSCTAQPAQAIGCNSRILVTFTQSAGLPPDAGLVREIARSAGVRLTYLGAVSANLGVFDLSAPGEPSCENALERLRHDARIRSADLDARRRHH